MAEYQTLKLNSDFRRTYGRGKSAADPVLVTYALRNRYGVMRIGITTGKKLGNAVERNRCRRIIRAAFRQLEGECCGGWDIVFVARHKTVSRKSTDIERSMRKQLGALGVIGISAGMKVLQKAYLTAAARYVQVLSDLLSVCDRGSRNTRSVQRLSADCCQTSSLQYPIPRRL